MHHLRGNAIPAGRRSFKRFWRNFVSLSLDSQMRTLKQNLNLRYSNVALSSSKSQKFRIFLKNSPQRDESP